LKGLAGKDLSKTILEKEKADRIFGQSEGKRQEILGNLGASPQLEYWNIGMMGSAVLELTLQGFIKG
jgi:hypothetical protein